MCGRARSSSVHDHVRTPKASANNTSKYRIKYIYFVSRSTTTSIKLYSTPVIGSLDSRSLIIKSYAINFYAHSSVSGLFIKL